MHITARMATLVKRHHDAYGQPPARITVGTLMHNRWLEELQTTSEVPFIAVGTTLVEFVGIPVEVCLEPFGMWPAEMLGPQFPEPAPGSAFAPGFAARAGLL